MILQQGGCIPRYAGILRVGRKRKRETMQTSKHHEGAGYHDGELGD